MSCNTQKIGIVRRFNRNCFCKVEPNMREIVFFNYFLVKIAFFNYEAVELLMN